MLKQPMIDKLVAMRLNGMAEGRIRIGRPSARQWYGFRGAGHHRIELRGESTPASLRSDS